MGSFLSGSSRYFRGGTSLLFWGGGGRPTFGRGVATFGGRLLLSRFTNGHNF